MFNKEEDDYSYFGSKRQKLYNIPDFRNLNEANSEIPPEAQKELESIYEKN